MRLAAVAVAVAASASATARADGFYLSESFGAGAIRDQLSSHVDSTTFAVRLALGARFGNWAIEPFLGLDQTNLGNVSSYSGDAPLLTSFGIDVKRIVPVTQHLSVYVRGRMSHIAFPDQQTACCGYEPAIAPGDLSGYAGRGLGFGAGVQLSGKGSIWGLLAWPLFFIDRGPRMNAALFVEEGYDYYRFLPPSGSYGSVDGSITRLTFGVAVGSDF